jgi:hypothetical protein
VWLLNVAVLGGLLVTPYRGQAASTSQDDLLRVLVEENEAAWQRIESLTSIQYTVEREWLDRRSQNPFHGIGRVKQRGKCLWSAYRFQIRTGPLRVVQEAETPTGTMHLLEPDTSVGQTEMTERRIVVNDQYVAEWLGPDNPLAYRWDHNSVDTMSEKTRQHVKMALPPDIVPNCFGEDRRRFLEAVKTAGDRRRYEAVEVAEEDGRRRYQIRRFYPPDALKSDVVWVIDPEKGFLATEKIFNGAREVPIYHRRMQVEEVMPGVWYPLGFEEARFAEPNQPGEPPKVEKWSRIALKDVRINEPIPDEQFDIKALGLQKNNPDITVLRATVHGQTIPYVYRDGKLVPRE